MWGDGDPGGFRMFALFVAMFLSTGLGVGVGSIAARVRHVPFTFDAAIVWSCGFFLGLHVLSYSGVWR